MEGEATSPTTGRKSGKTSSFWLRTTAALALSGTSLITAPTNSLAFMLQPHHTPSRPHHQVCVGAFPLELYVFLSCVPTFAGVASSLSLSIIISKHQQCHTSLHGIRRASEGVGVASAGSRILPLNFQSNSRGWALDPRCRHRGGGRGWLGRYV